MKRKSVYAQAYGFGLIEMMQQNELTQKMLISKYNYEFCELMLCHFAMKQSKIFLFLIMKEVERVTNTISYVSNFRCVTLDNVFLH